MNQLPDQECQRSLIVIPKSHRLYYPYLMNTDTAKQATGHWCTLNANWKHDTISIKDLEARAIQLDLKPNINSRNISRSSHIKIVIWSSRCFHQGGTSLSKEQQELHGFKMGDFVPPLYQPRVFEFDPPSEWLAYLEEEGYVVISLDSQITESESQDLLHKLWEDITTICPDKEIHSLDEVTIKHLPHARQTGLTLGYGITHGEFAWGVRLLPIVQQIFQQLHGNSNENEELKSKKLGGSVDALALSPPTIKNNNVNYNHIHAVNHPQWLHTDQVIHVPMGQQPMFQSTVYFFPNEKTPGHGWERIAMMVCKAPTTDRTASALHRLLAMSVCGQASTHWPQLGICHQPRYHPNKLSSPVPLRLLKPKLSPLLTQEVLSNMIEESITNNRNLTEEDVLFCRKLTVTELPLLDVEQLQVLFTIEQLSDIVHPRVLHYLGI